MLDQAAVPTVPDRPVYRARGWRMVSLWLLSVVVRVWCRTLRVEIEAEDLAAGSYADEPVMILLWHNRLFVVPWIARHLRNRRPVYALVSASRDGANLAKFFEYLGVRTVRGSSSRLGREALHELIAWQRAGYDLAITPDGPRGPLYEMKPGALLACRRTGASLLLLGIELRNAWRLRSWDRFHVPKPFSRMRVRCERLDVSGLGHGHGAVERLRARLLELNGETG